MDKMKAGRRKRTLLLLGNVQVDTWVQLAAVGSGETVVTTVVGLDLTEMASGFFNVRGRLVGVVV